MKAASGELTVTLGRIIVSDKPPIHWDRIQDIGTKVLKALKYAERAGDILEWVVEHFLTLFCRKEKSQTMPLSP